MRNLCHSLRLTQNQIKKQIGVLLFGCSDSENLNLENNENMILDKNQIFNATLKQQIDYKRHHLKNISKWLVKHGLEKLATESKNKKEILVSDLVEKTI